MERREINIPYTIKMADSFLKRFKGLMFRKDPIKNEGLWIVPCNSIHMFFMRFPIDVVLLNERNEVVMLYRCLKPWRTTRYIKSAHSTIELPEGAIEELGITKGSIIHCATMN